MPSAVAAFSFMQAINLSGSIRRFAGVLASLYCFMSFQHPAAAAGNFIQLYIASQGGCGGAWNPLSFILTGQDIRSPFGKTAADWSDDDLTSLKIALAACEAASARQGNPYNLDNIKRESDRLLLQIPDIVGRAKDQAKAEAQQIEARRQLATTRIDKAAQARQKAKASAETEVARLENEASVAESAARDTQARAETRVEQATRIRDNAMAKADALADLERRAAADAGAKPRPRRALPDELSELAQDEEKAAPQSDKPSGPITVTTTADTEACNSIEAIATADRQTT